MPHNCFQHQRILLGFLKDHDNEEIQLSHQRNKLHFAIYSHRKQLFLNCDKINCNFNPINAGEKKTIKTGVLLGVSHVYLLGHTVICKQWVISVSLAGRLSLSESVTSHFS